MRGQSAAGGSSRQSQPLRGATLGQQEFTVGSKVQCAATFDGQQHAADVLDIRTAADGKKQYYVHFIGLDKRLDEWVPADKLSAPSQHVLARLESVPSLALPAELLTQADGQKITRRLKRKLEDSHVVPTHDDAADHHAPKTGLEKEHAERNKVKNVQVRLLGCAGMVLADTALLKGPAAADDIRAGAQAGGAAAVGMVHSTVATWLQQQTKCWVVLLQCEQLCSAARNT